jgi:Chlorophyll A-B binding protein
MSPQYAAAVAKGDVYKASIVTGVPSPLQGSNNGVSLENAMAFGGPAPELINGRAAMIAIVAALGAELSSHETVLKQLSDQPTGIVLAAILIAAGSLVPILDGKNDAKSPLGFMTAGAELINARAAMMGFVALLCTEELLGHSLL